MKRLHRLLIAGMFCLFVGSSVALAPASAQNRLPSTTWVTLAEDGMPEIHLYYFWSSTCPHCREASPFVQNLARFHPWLKLHSHELLSSQANVHLYRQMASGIGKEARSVPAFMFCGDMMTGFDTDETTGRQLQRKLFECFNEQKEKAEAGD